MQKEIKAYIMAHWYPRQQEIGLKGLVEIATEGAAQAARATADDVVALRELVQEKQDTIEGLEGRIAELMGEIKYLEEHLEDYEEESAQADAPVANHGGTPPGEG